MRKEEKEKVRTFVGGLCEADVRNELLLAYECMERCVCVLKGEAGIKPVKMRDNGISSDLELYYSCKNAAERMYGVEPQIYEEDEE